MATEYTQQYYDEIDTGSLRSARVVVPLVMNLTHPASVVDVGCGTGAWLQAFRESGVEDYLGIDGEYVARESLHVPADHFLVFDLEQPMVLERTFDLVVSVEVGEHLPAERASIYVDSLIRLGSAILFSAAIPYQPGNRHINTQWPDYWIELFGSRGYVVIDCLRQHLWTNPDVEYWYAQNLLLFVTPEFLARHPRLRAEQTRYAGFPLRLVHPGHYLHWIVTAKWHEDRATDLENYLRRLEDETDRLQSQARRLEVDRTKLQQAAHEYETRSQELRRELAQTKSLLNQLEQAPGPRVVMRGLRQLLLPIGSQRYRLYKRMRHQR